MIHVSIYIIYIGIGIGLGCGGEPNKKGVGSMGLAGISSWSVQAKLHSFTFVWAGEKKEKKRKSKFYEDEITISLNEVTS